MIRGEERRACKKQSRPREVLNTTGGVRPNQWMQMPSPHQPRVPPWLRMPRMCGTNPQDLVCFPPYLPSALNSFPHLPCLSRCTNFSTVLNFVSRLIFMFVYSCHHDLLSINPLSDSCSLLPVSRPLIFPTVWLLASFLSSFWLSLTASYFFPLLPHSLSSNSIPLSLWWLQSLLYFPFPVLLLALSSSSSLRWYHEHTDIGRALKFISTSAADSTQAFQGSQLWPCKNSATMATR